MGKTFGWRTIFDTGVKVLLFSPKQFIVIPIFIPKKTVFLFYLIEYKNNMFAITFIDNLVNIYGLL